MAIGCNDGIGLPVQDSLIHIRNVHSCPEPHRNPEPLQSVPDAPLAQAHEHRDVDYRLAGPVELDHFVKLLGGIATPRCFGHQRFSWMARTRLITSATSASWLSPERVFSMS